MSLNINHVILAGNLTRDPKTRFLANEKAVADFGLAINRRFKAADGTLKEDTTFVDIEAWGRTAELVGQYLTKGSPCYVEGRIKLDQWEDKESGQKRSKLLIVADSVQFLGSKRDGNAAPSEEARPVPAPRRPAAPSSGGSGDDDSPPF